MTMDLYIRCIWMAVFLEKRGGMFYEIYRLYLMILGSPLEFRTPSKMDHVRN